jgi:hypothetical protein
MARQIDQYERDGYLVTIYGGDDITLRHERGSWAEHVGRAFQITVGNLDAPYTLPAPAWREPETIYPALVSAVYPVHEWPTTMYMTAETRPIVDAWVDDLIHQARGEPTQFRPDGQRGYTTEDAAAELGITRDRVQQLVRARGWGAGTGRATLLTQAQIDQLRERKQQPGPAPKTTRP